jgi:type I restriction enzyme R subunit
VPEICNLVFLRRVNSRILFDQMLGRATRLCDFGGNDVKDAFRVFDAVRIFEAIGNMTAMQARGRQPEDQLHPAGQELATLKDDRHRAGARPVPRQAAAQEAPPDRQAAAGLRNQGGYVPQAFIQKLRAMPLADVANVVHTEPGLGELLDRKQRRPGEPSVRVRSPDRLRPRRARLWQGHKPEDYLRAFSDFIKSHSNQIPALVTVLTRPRELTRKQLRELVLALDRAGFTETNLASAWRELTNQDIAARIVGYIRQAAIGDALLPYAERVDRACSICWPIRRQASPGARPQRDWLKRIARRPRPTCWWTAPPSTTPTLIFKREGGGFNRLDKVFNGQLQPVLDAFNDALWALPPEAANR